MLTKKEKLEQKRIEALLKAHQNKSKELAMPAKTGNNCEAYYTKGKIKQRMTYGHPEDFDLSYTNKKKKAKKVKYTLIQKRENKILITDFVITKKA